MSAVEKFAPRDQVKFTPTAEHPHRSPLQEPDEILIPGMTDEPAPKKAAAPKMEVDDGMDDDFGKTTNTDMKEYSKVVSLGDEAGAYLESLKPKPIDPETDTGGMT